MKITDAADPNGLVSYTAILACAASFPGQGAAGAHPRAMGCVFPYPRVDGLLNRQGHMAQGRGEDQA